jgi:hypothetical protein
MKSFIKNGIGKVVTDYGTRVMDILSKGRLGQSVFTFFGIVRTDAVQFPEKSAPATPSANRGGVVYVKSDGKIYYKSSEVAEVELSASDAVLTTEEVQDIAGPLVATGGTKTGITITYDDDNNNMDFVVDHDAATNFVAEEHYRWDNDIQSTATINHVNLSSDTGTDGEVLVVIDGDAVWGHPEKIHLQVRNDEGATIPAGAPLYSKIEIGGSGRLKVGICDADDPAKMPCIGLAEAEMNTTSTKDNFAITQGVYNTNISGFTGLAVGDTLYVDTSGSAPHLTKTKPTGESSLIQNIGIVLKTNGSICQGLQVSAIGRTNDVPNLNSGNIFMGNGSNQAVPTGRQSALNSLTASSSASAEQVLIRSSSGDAAFGALDVSNDNAVTGALPVAHGGTGLTSISTLLNSNTTATDVGLGNVTNESKATMFTSPTFTGSANATNLTLTGTLGVSARITNGGTNNDLDIESDGSITFKLDVDNDETGQAFSFVNTTTEIANLNESGRLTTEGGVISNGDVVVNSGANALTVNCGTANVGMKIVSTDSDSLLVFEDNDTADTVACGVVDDDFIIRTDDGGLKVKTQENAVTALDIANSGNLTTPGIIVGKQREVFFQNFLDDLGTTKHYLPFKDINEQTTIYQEEAAIVAPCDGRVVSITVKVMSITGSGDMTVGINTIAPDLNAFTASNWTEEETETLAVTSTDDYHVFHFAFDNAKHFDSGDLVSLHIQNSADLSGATYWYVTTVIEYDWNTFLGTTSGEYESNP